MKDKIFTLVTNSYENCVGDANDRTSISGYLMNFGSTTVSWSCKRKEIVANFSIKVE